MAARCWFGKHLGRGPGRHTTTRATKRWAGLSMADHAAAQSVTAALRGGSPLGLVIQTRGRVQIHHLVVLHGEVLTRALQVRHLHRAASERMECNSGRLVTGSSAGVVRQRGFGHGLQRGLHCFQVTAGAEGLC